jgi:anti-sigma regulatory factor (Ser/Thr protein kinase)
MVAVEVRDQSQVAEARRIATTLAGTCGCGVTSTGKVAIVATELATNLLKHGGGGQLLLSTFEEADVSGVQLIALDSGRGMRDVQACLEDGYSTAGSAGHGLGAIQRQSQFFEIASWPDLGTAIVSRVACTDTAAAHIRPSPHLGIVGVAMPGQEVSGDAVSVAETGQGRTLMVVDGLGHGPEAATAATEAVRIFQRNADRPISELLQFIHAGLRATRGAAAAIARLDPSRPTVNYGGVGNIAGVVTAAGQSRHMISMNGTLGHNARKVQAFEYPCPSGALVILHSDGIGTSWSLDRYSGLHRRHPILIAAVLYRDYGRRRDDATVMVAVKA